MLLPKRKRTLATDPMTVVTRFVEAANRHDADGVEACLHPEFESIQPIHPSRNFKGSRQVRRNWQAIFDAEPGFRLTVLRAATTHDTAWVELHGAGRHAEVAGVLVFGVEDGKLRWSRIYSELVEQPIVPTEGHPEAAATVVDETASAAAEEAEVAEARPVFEVIDGEKGDEDEAAEAAEAAEEAEEVAAGASEGDATETLVGSDVGDISDAATAGAAGSTDAVTVEVEPEVVGEPAGSAAEAGTDADAEAEVLEAEIVEVAPKPKAKRATRSRKAKTSPADPAKSRRTRKKTT